MPDIIFLGFDYVKHTVKSRNHASFIYTCTSASNLANNVSVYVIIHIGGNFIKKLFFGMEINSNGKIVYT